VYDPGQHTKSRREDREKGRAESGTHWGRLEAPAIAAPPIDRQSTDLCCCSILMPEIPVLLHMTSETTGRLHGTGVLLVPSFLGHPLAARDTAGGTVFRSPLRRTQPRPFAAKSHIDLVRGPDAPVRKRRRSGQRVCPRLRHPSRQQ